MIARPKVELVTEYGNAASFWVEYPSGLVDLSRSTHIVKTDENEVVGKVASTPPPPLKQDSQWELQVDGDRVLRLSKTQTAVIIVDMQNFFLHPDLRAHPKGLACVQPLMDVIPALRSAGAKIIWVNWGLTDHELTTIPPSLIRSFMKAGRGGFGAQMAGDFGRLLMRGAYNSDLYGPLQKLYEDGKADGTDVWIHKNRMSGLWGPQSALDLYLQEEGITTLLFAGVNADQCVLGTLVDSYYRGYDCIVIRDAIATTSPQGGYENVIFNAGNAYGFVTDSSKIITGASKA